MASTEDDPLNVRVETLLKGRFDRPAFRETVTGLVLSDIAAMPLEEFLAGLRIEDRHIGKVFWKSVLGPVRDAYIAYDRTAPMRETVDAARQNLQKLVGAHQKAAALAAAAAIVSGGAGPAHMNPTRPSSP